jgi:hypothetical protein
MSFNSGSEEGKMPRHCWRQVSITDSIVSTKRLALGMCSRLG